MSPIDAVFLTHEHDDHFDIASLLRVDRRIPMLISARSSVAMGEFLGAQGFEVRRIEPDSTTRIGDVWLRSFVADHRATPEADEWDAFARFLYARPVFAQIHSLPTSDALAFVLHTQSAPAVFAYRPAAARFERVDMADPFTRFFSGFECWASDLLALFEGRVGPSALCYSGRLRCWNRAADQLRISPHLLWLFSHPLHRPEVARALYEHVAASCGSVTVEVRPQPNSARAITSF